MVLTTTSPHHPSIWLAAKIASAVIFIHRRSLASATPSCCRHRPPRMGARDQTIGASPPAAKFLIVLLHGLVRQSSARGPPLRRTGRRFALSGPWGTHARLSAAHAALFRAFLPWPTTRKHSTDITPRSQRHHLPPFCSLQGPDSSLMDLQRLRLATEASQILSPVAPPYPRPSSRRHSLPLLCTCRPRHAPK